MLKNIIKDLFNKKYAYNIYFSYPTKYTKEVNKCVDIVLKYIDKNFGLKEYQYFNPSNDSFGYWGCYNYN